MMRKAAASVPVSGELWVMRKADSKRKHYTQPGDVVLVLGVWSAVHYHNRRTGTEFLPMLGHFLAHFEKQPTTGEER